jgi:transmembrane sensor
MSIDRIWELFAKKFSKEITAQEEKELESLLHENQDAFMLNELISKFHKLKVRPISDDMLEDRSRKAIREAIGSLQEGLVLQDAMDSEPIHIASKSIRWFRIAGFAAAAMVVGLIWGIFFMREKGGDGTGNMNEIKTDALSKSTVSLPDGSVVILNAGSELSYNKEFGTRSREIKLVGEAYFNIKKNPNMPLVVHASTVDIWVKGTTFNVKAYPKDSTVEAALLTGVIELVSQKDPERKILMRPNEKVIVSEKTSDRPIPATTKTVKVENKETISLSRMQPDSIDNSYPELNWLKNKIVFRSQTFRSLAKEMEIKYNVAFEFKDEGIAERIFTGSFTDETLEEAMEALKTTVPFHYRIEGRTVFIKK